MDKTELREGNIYVDSHGGISKVVLFGNRENFTPVELSSLWLQNFGFELIAGRDGYIQRKDDFEIGQVSDGWFIQFGVENMNSIRIKYVHQLQNIYFYLTGKEL